MSSDINAAAQCGGRQCSALTLWLLVFAMTPSRFQRIGPSYRLVAKSEEGEEDMLRRLVDYIVKMMRMTLGLGSPALKPTTRVALFVEAEEAESVTKLFFAMGVTLDIIKNA